MNCEHQDTPNVFLFEQLYKFKVASILEEFLRRVEAVQGSTL